MVKKMVMGLTVLLTVLFSITAKATSVFSEDWENGLDANKWHAFGSPACYIYTGAEAYGAGSLDNNGDSSFASGLVCNDSFQLMPGMKVSFLSKLHAAGSSSRNPWQWNAMEITYSTPDKFGDDQLNISQVGILHSGGTNTHVPAEDAMTIYHIGYEGGIYDRYEYGVNMFDTPATDFGAWVNFSFEFQPDGSVDYYKNGLWVLSTDAGMIDYSEFDQARVVLRGRCVSTVNLLDQINVVPEPATIALLAFGGLGLLRRRKKNLLKL